MIDDLLVQAKGLVSLLADPHPGLSSWCLMLGRHAEKLWAKLGELLEKGPEPGVLPVDLIPDPVDADHALPEDNAILAAHPVHSGRHDLYVEAMRLVGAKHSKAALVDLVNWLLHRAEQANAFGQWQGEQRHRRGPGG